MNPSFTPSIEQKRSSEKDPGDFVFEFLGDASEYLHEDALAKIISDARLTQPEILDSLKTKTEHSRVVLYDKYKKRFTVSGEEGLTIGTIVSARHMGIDVNLPDELDTSGDGKKLRKILAQKISEDCIANNINRELGNVLAEKTKMRDALKSEAYQKIADRAGIKSEQLGVQAEQVMMGALEAIAIDHSDLGLSITPGNAYQDVEEKIDFIISTKTKKREVEVEKNETVFDEKHIGIQFTINTSKKIHKLDQITKAKARGVDVDDILYVAIDMKILRQAIAEWEGANKPIKGPWSFLPEHVRKTAILNFFDSILTSDQIRGLVNNA